MKNTLLLALSLALGLTLGTTSTAWAAGDHDAHHAAHHASPSTSAASNALTEGEIKKVDKDAGKITIRHAELKNLGMPAMTMVFQVKDKRMLEPAKVGDQIHFTAEKIDGKLTVTRLEPNS